jgi:hypothetical protein
MVENWSSSMELQFSTGNITQVQDFEYFGARLLKCTKDFKVGIACAPLVKELTSDLLNYTMLLSGLLPIPSQES